MINLKNTNRFDCFLLCWVIILMLAGCTDSQSRKSQLSDLDNPDSTIKIMAIKWAGDNKASAAVPQLVNLLQDEDRSVRFFSIEALQRITDTDCGYDYKAAPDARGEAVKCWHQFLKTEQSRNGSKESQNDKD